MNEQIRIQYTSTNVDVSDERGTVRGASVRLAYGDGGAYFEGEVIPEEGDCLSAWAGRLAEHVVAHPDLVRALAYAAEEGAAGRSGYVEVEAEDEDEDEDEDAEDRGTFDGFTVDELIEIFDEVSG